MVLVLNPILCTLGFLHQKDGREELVAVKTGVLSKNTQRHRLAYVEIVCGGFFPLSSDGSCGMPVFKITKLFKVGWQ